MDERGEYTEGLFKARVDEGDNTPGKRTDYCLCHCADHALMFDAIVVDTVLRTVHGRN
jgi:hypothetical protein